MTVIELSDEQAAALKAKAAAAGLTLEAWLKQLAGAAEAEPVEHPLQTAAEIVLGRMRNVPPEIMATMPKDGASQHDHYIYGWPKKEALVDCISMRTMRKEGLTEVLTNDRHFEQEGFRALFREF